MNNDTVMDICLNSGNLLLLALGFSIQKNIQLLKWQKNSQPSKIAAVIGPKKIFITCIFGQKRFSVQKNIQLFPYSFNIYCC